MVYYTSVEIGNRYQHTKRVRRKPGKSSRAQKIRLITNERIRASEVRVLDHTGEAVGVMSRNQALVDARNQGRDLVLIAPQAKPPVVKIIDAAKHRYQLQQKQSNERKKTKTVEIKEVRFTPFMGEGDFQSRLKKVQTFLEKGDKVKLTLRFRGRAITKQEFGHDLFNRVIEATAEISKVELEPKMMGKQLIAQLTPSK